MKLERLLLPTSRWLSAHATFCLMTLLIFLGIALGLWQGHQNYSSVSKGTTRSAASTSVCAQASLRFSPQTTLSDLSQLLREEDAHLLYGPDEFGEYQLRFASSMDVSHAISRMQQHPLVEHLRAHPACP